MLQRVGGTELPASATPAWITADRRPSGGACEVPRAHPVKCDEGRYRCCVHGTTVAMINRMQKTRSAGRFKSVLCPVDFSEYSAAALRYASAITKRSGGRLHAMYVNDPLLVTTAAIALGNRHLVTTSREELDGSSRKRFVCAPPQAPAIRCHVDKGNPARTIASAAKRLRCDLIVMGTHGLSGIDRLLVGSTTERLLGRADIPVLAIPPALEVIGPKAPGRSWPGPTILAPVDLGPESHRDIRAAADLARAFDADLLLLHVVPQFQPPPWYLADLSAQTQLRLEQAQRQLESLAGRIAGDVRVEARVRTGNIPDEIALAAAVARVGLVVMHLRKGRGWFGSRAGSIAYHVLQHAITPVLALPDRWDHAVGEGVTIRHGNAIFLRRASTDSGDGPPVNPHSTQRRHGHRATLHSGSGDGANDGIITTFAVVAGVAGGALSDVAVLIVGGANLAADGLSMAVGNFLSIRAHESAREAEHLPEEESQPVRHAVATFIAFVLAGAIPLVPYIVPVVRGHELTGSVLATMAALFGVGAARSTVTFDRWWRAGFEMLGLGIIVAAAAYGAGALMARLAA